MPAMAVFGESPPVTLGRRATGCWLIEDTLEINGRAEAAQVQTSSRRGACATRPRSP
jgi:hypothetical protein